MPPDTNIVEMLQTPLWRQNPGQGSFLRLVLVEAAAYGMPPQVLATLDSVAAMLGFYEPLPPKLASH